MVDARIQAAIGVDPTISLENIIAAVSRYARSKRREEIRTDVSLTEPIRFPEAVWKSSFSDLAVISGQVRWGASIRVPKVQSAPDLSTIYETLSKMLQPPCDVGQMPYRRMTFIEDFIH